MAIKFSQFVVRTNSSDLSHIVGYNGVDNIQITPTNFLNSALTGTAGQVLFYDTTGVAGDNELYWDNTNKRLGVGSTVPQQKLHVFGTTRISGTNNLDIFSDNTAATFNLASNARGFLFKNLNGDLVTINSSGNVGIGTTSPGEKLEVNGNIKVGDSQQFIAGANNDLRIIHDGTDSLINSNGTGHLYIQQFNDDKDIYFRSDDGSGGVTTYFYLDGSDVKNRFSKTVQLGDNVYFYLGDQQDLGMFHNGTSTVINNNTGNLTIKNSANNSDIVFQCDDGSGGLATYFQLDGGQTQTRVFKNFKFEDNVQGLFGTSDDLQIFHNGTDSFIDNYTGNLTIRNRADDGDIVFTCDDGSGGLAEYFRVDGGVSYTIASKAFRFLDTVNVQLGNSADFTMQHNATNTELVNVTGNLNIKNSATDGDISFFGDDGSGGVTPYFFLDGSRADGTYIYTEFPDYSVIGLGNDTDLQLYHNGSNSMIDNFVADLIIQQRADDGDIIFKSDDGSGGVATYFSVDGGGTDVNFFKDTHHIDNVKAKFGSTSTGDLQIYHDGTDSIIKNTVGNLYISNSADNQDIHFQCDDGSGGLAEYFRVDGGAEAIIISKNVQHADNVKAFFGNAIDLAIYHDGTNSYIDDSGTGDLRIRSNFVTIEKYNNGEIMASFNDDNSVSLYFNNSKKLETKSTGINIQSVPTYADNAAAIAGGLTTGDVYRTGDLLKIVH